MIFLKSSQRNTLGLMSMFFRPFFRQWSDLPFYGNESWTMTYGGILQPLLQCRERDDDSSTLRKTAKRAVSDKRYLTVHYDIICEQSCAPYSFSIRSFNVKRSSKFFENSFLKNSIVEFWFEALVSILTHSSNDNQFHKQNIISTKIVIMNFSQNKLNCHSSQRGG